MYGGGGGFDGGFVFFVVLGGGGGFFVCVLGGGGIRFGVVGVWAGVGLLVGLEFGYVGVLLVCSWFFLFWGGW